MSGDGYGGYGYTPYYGQPEARHDQQSYRSERPSGRAQPASTTAYSAYFAPAHGGIGQGRTDGLGQEVQHGSHRPTSSSSQYGEPGPPMQRASQFMFPPSRQMEGFGAVVDPTPPELHQSSTEVPLTVDPNDIFGPSEHLQQRYAADGQSTSAGQIPPSPITSPPVQSTSQAHHARSESGSREQLQAEMRAMIAKMQDYKSKDPTLFTEAWEQLKRDMPAKALAKKSDIASPQIAAQVVDAVVAGAEPPLSSLASAALLDFAKFPAQQRQRISDVGAARVTQASGQRTQAEKQLQQTLSVQTTPAGTVESLPTGQLPTATQGKKELPPKGKTIWPEAKRAMLAQVAVKLLTADRINDGKAVTPNEIQSWLRLNPTYDELCEKLYAKGFQFEKGVFARHLLSAMAESGSNSTSPPPAAPGLPTTQSPNVGLKRKRDSSPGSKSKKVSSANFEDMSARSSNAVDPRSSHGSFDTSKLNPLQAAQGNGPSGGFFPKPALSTVPQKINSLQAHSAQPHALPVKVSSNALTKEAMARKSDFSDLMDLTQLPDSDEDEAAEAAPNLSNFAKSDAPRPQIDQVQSVSSINQPAAALPRDSSLSEGQKAALAKVKITPLAQDLNIAKAARKSSYNPATIARDVLIARGDHLTERPLNFHLDCLRVSFRPSIQLKTDLSTFRWDLVDPVDDRALQRQQEESLQGPDRAVTPTPLSRPHHQGVNVDVASAAPSINQASIARGEGTGPAADVALATPGTSKRSPAKTAAHHRDPATTKPGSITSRTFVAVEHAGPGLATEGNSAPKGRISASTEQKGNAAPIGVRPAGLVTPRRASDKMTTPKSSASRQGRTPQPGSASMQARLAGLTRDSSADTAPGVKRRGRPPGSKNSPSARKPGRQPKAKAKTAVVNTTMPEDGIGVVVRSSPLSTGPVEVSYVEERPPSLEKETSRMKARQADPDPSNPVAYQTFNCRWIGCKASLHNLETLRKHLSKVHKDKCWDDKTLAYSCFWNDCEEFDAFPDVSAWEAHVQKVHLEPLARELGDGPTTHPAAPDLSYLMDDKGRFVVPIARTEGTPDPLPLYAGRGPTRAYHKAHGNDTPEARAQAERESLKFHAICAARARQGEAPINKTAEWRTDWEGPSGMESSAVSASEEEEVDEINVIDAMVE